MDEEGLLSYHRFTRDHGVNRPLYYFARLVLTPFFPSTSGSPDSDASTARSPGH
jgi:hypothetical protein